MSGRWVAVSTDLLHSQHRWHPHSSAESACKAFAWIDLIGLAAWRDHGGLKRGQARASQRYLAARWNWGRGKVARFLDELESEGAIVRAEGASREPDRITICKYDDYQNSRATNGASDGATNRATSGATNGAKEVQVQVPEQGTVLSEPEKPGVENSDEPWNDRLAPVARELGNVGRWLRWAKDLDDPERAERIMDGLRSLRDRGALDYCVKPGVKCAPGVLTIKNEGQPVIRRAEDEWYRIHRPKRAHRRSTEPQQFNVSVGGAA